MVSWMLSRPSKSCKKTEVKGDENHGHKQAHRHWNTRARPHQEASSAHLALWVQTWPTAISSCSTLRVTSASSAVVKEMEWCLKQPPPPLQKQNTTQETIWTHKGYVGRRGPAGHFESVSGRPGEPHICMGPEWLQLSSLQWEWGRDFS